MSVLVSLSRIKNTVGPTVRRFWASIVFSVALTVTLIGIVETQFHARTDLVRLAWALVPGIFVALDAILLCERAHQQKVQANHRINPELTANLIAFTAACPVVATTYLMLGELNLVSLSRQIAISLFLAVAFFVIPYVHREGSLEMYIVKMFTHAVVTIVFSAVLFVGLSAITFAANSLFSLNISERIYFEIWLVMAGTVAPFLFMAGIPRKTLQSDSEDYPKVLRNLVLFVITPLLTTYALVLYLYFAKILITRQWPVGLVSHLVLWYSLVSTAILLFLSPLCRESRWAYLFSKAFPIIVIPLLLMMFTSMGIRIKHYGITENRYYVLILGLWVFASMVYLAVAKKPKSIVLPASLALVVVLAVVGPWSSFSVSKWSQNRRLEGLLTKNGMLQNGTVFPATVAVPPSDRKEIAEILFYFERNHDLADVRLLPPGFNMAQFKMVFGFEPSDAVPVRPHTYVTYESSNQSLDIGGFQYLFDLGKAPATGISPISLSRDNVGISYDLESKRLTITNGGNSEWETSLSDYVARLKLTNEDGKLPRFNPEDMTLSAESANLRIKLVITALGAEVPAEESTGARLDHVGFYVLVGEK